MVKKSTIPLLFLACGLLSCSVIGLNQKQAPKATSAADYYSSIDKSWTGRRLLAGLHDLITSTHTIYTSYNDAGSGGKQKETDKYYDSNNNPQSGYIFEFYSGAKWDNSWVPNNSGGYNREHCWPQSLSNGLWGQTGGGADLHHLRPVETALNENRGNAKYGEVTNRDSKKLYAVDKNGTSYLGGYATGSTAGSTYEPIDSKKGDVARIIMYVYTHYNSYTITDIFGNYGTTDGSTSYSDYFAKSKLSITKVMSTSSEEAAFNLLLKWNKQDPVDYAERQRNEKVYYYQNNRNPFIDNETYADAIWGNGGQGGETADIHLNKTQLTLGVGGNYTLKALDPDDVEVKNVYWTSSDSIIATVDSNGRISALREGTCTITATSGTKTATCALTVKDYSGGGDEGGSTGGCRGSILAPSITVFSTTLLGLGLLVIKKKGSKK